MAHKHVGHAVHKDCMNNLMEKLSGIDKGTRLNKLIHNIMTKGNFTYPK